MIEHLESRRLMSGGHAATVQKVLSAPYVPGNLTVEHDGKLLEVPFHSIGSEIDVVRFNPDGSPDVTFGSGGVAAPPSPLDSFVKAIELKDGELVAVGFSPGSFLLIGGFGPSGKPDTTFGTDGVVSDTHASFTLMGGVPTPDGGFIVAGEDGATQNLQLRHYTGTGSLDDAFGQQGVAVVPDYPVPGATALKQIDALAVDSAGGILVGEDMEGGTSSLGPEVIYHFNPDGSRDSQFGSSGVVQTRVSASTYLQAAAYRNPVILALPNQAFAVGGIDSSGAQVVQRFDAAGQLDPAFGQHGTLILHRSCAASAIAVAPSGMMAVISEHDHGRWVPRPTEGRDFLLNRTINVQYLTPEGKPERGTPRPTIRIHNSLNRNTQMTAVFDPSGNLLVQNDDEAVRIAVASGSRSRS